jgi:hypothetical protein
VPHPCAFFLAQGWDRTPDRTSTNARHPDRSRLSGGGKDPLLFLLLATSATPPTPRITLE